SADWDTRGHWRIKRQYDFDPQYDGTFDGPVYRTTVTAYPHLENGDPKNYLGKWILNTYDSIALQDAYGANQRYATYDFDSFGRLAVTRSYLNPAGLPPT